MKMASRSIELIKKSEFARAAHFFLISKKTNLPCSTLFCLSLPLFCGEGNRRNEFAEWHVCMACGMT